MVKKSRNHAVNVRKLGRVYYDLLRAMDAMGPGQVELRTNEDYTTSIRVLFRTVSSEILDRDLLPIACAGGAGHFSRTRSPGLQIADIIIARCSWWLDF